MKKEANPVLAGLAVGILLFGFMLCTAGLVVLPRLADRLNVLPTTGQTWTPPPEIPTPTPPEPTPTPEPLDEPDGGVSADGNYQPGDRLQNVNDGPVNMRRSPGYIEKPVTDRVALIPAGAILTVVDGPREADGLRWWLVRYEGNEGWMAETRASGPPILAPAP
ncbi:MAG: hypothetical protein J5I90_16235 [Caldilineales bacterium]|nr:hypothetical protein [Caldilineales bacterium]